MSGNLVLLCGFGKLLAQSVLTEAWFNDLFGKNFSPPNDEVPALRLIERDDHELAWSGQPAFDDSHMLEFVNRWIAVRRPQDRFFVLVVLLANERLCDRAHNTLTPWVGLTTFSPVQFSSVSPRANQTRNQLQRDVRDRIRAYAKRADIFVRHFFEAKRRTPLLLPVEKTDQKVIPLLEYLYNYDGNDVQGAVLAAVKKFDQQRGVAKSQLGHKQRERFYQINGLIFRCPAGEGHGWQRQPECRPDCFLRARMRLGVSIDPQFHYDCVSGAASLPSHYSSCHGQSVRPTRARSKGYVNIAPNDFVR